MITTTRRVVTLGLTSVVLALLLTGCPTLVKVTTEAPAPYAANPTGAMRIGLGQTNLTPPPGYAMMGYAIAGRFSRGMFNRLYCTSMAVQDSAGTTLVIVATDLWGMPQGFKRRVVQMLQDEGLNWLGEEDILMTSIHTHHGPAGYVPDKAYALGSIGFAFNAPLFHYLTRQVADAIATSIKDMQSADGSKRRLLYGTGSVADVVTNRSIPAFLRNPDIERGAMSDSTVAVLAVAQGNDLVGLLAHMSVHPTAIGEDGEIYSSDIFGMTRDLASLSDTSDAPTFIMGFMNGAEGDQAPKNVDVHGLKKARRMARAVYNCLDDILESDMTVLQGPIEHYFQNVSLKSQPVTPSPLDTDCYCSPQVMGTTAESALAGVALLGGASDGLTEFYFMGLRDGVRDETGCLPGQGPKLDGAAYAIDSVLVYGLNDEISELAAGAIQTKPLEETSISIHRIGSFTLIGCPGEPSMTLGKRITDSVRTRFGNDASYLFCGLSDDYVSYMTTPCEYAEQAYEGASMYWGPNMGMHIASSLGRLASTSPLSPDQRTGASYSYDVGREAPFGSLVIARQRKWNPHVSMAIYLEGAPVEGRFHDRKLSKNTVVVRREDSSAVRLQFRSVYADLKDDGTLTRQRMYPEWTISSGRKKLYTAVTNDEIDRPNGVGEWSIWLFNPYDLEPGEYTIRVSAFKDRVREYVVKVM